MASSSLFILTLILPAVFAVIWFALTIYVVAFRLREMKPAMMFTAVFIIFAIGSQVLYWLAGKPLCEVRRPFLCRTGRSYEVLTDPLLSSTALQTSNGKVDGAFLATLFETAGMVSLYFCWTGITEDR
jgi:hypothetical protein